MICQRKVFCAGKILTRCVWELRLTKKIESSSYNRLQMGKLSLGQLISPKNEWALVLTKLFLTFIKRIRMKKVKIFSVFVPEL